MKEQDQYLVIKGQQLAVVVVVVHHLNYHEGEESSARSPPFPRGYIWFFGLLGGGPPLYRLFVLSERPVRACSPFLAQPPANDPHI